MVFGIILVLMMIFRPQGIFPARRRQRELAHTGKDPTGVVP
jgi:ABC-type branched-subunit amino acid transport system permease subunit